MKKKQNTIKLMLTRDVNGEIDFTVDGTFYVNTKTTDRSWLNILYGTANVLFEHGKYMTALEVTTKAIREIDGNLDLLGKMYAFRGKIYQMLGRNDDAREDITHALEIANGTDQPLVAGDATIVLGLIYRAENRFMESHEAYQAAADIFEEHQAFSKAADAYKLLGGDHRFLGDSDQTMTYLEESLMMAEKTKDKTTIANFHSMMGMVLYDTNNAKKALEFSQKHPPIPFGNIHGYIYHLLNLSEIQSLLGDNASAVSNARKALKSSSTTKLPSLNIYSLARLTNAYRIIGDLDSARIALAKCRTRINRYHSFTCDMDYHQAAFALYHKMGNSELRQRHQEKLNALIDDACDGLNDYHQKTVRFHWEEYLQRMLNGRR
jgi:tetratricopeptide (TPR) repeat protein